MREELERRGQQRLIKDDQVVATPVQSDGAEPPATHAC